MPQGNCRRWDKSEGNQRCVGVTWFELVGSSFQIHTAAKVNNKLVRRSVRGSKIPAILHQHKRL